MAEDSVAQDQLRAFIERIERMEEEKAAIAADIKEIYAEAKGNGFDVKTLRRLVNIRKQDANERMEQEALLELYMSALGMIAAPDFDQPRAPYQAQERGAIVRANHATPEPQETQAPAQMPSVDADLLRSDGLEASLAGAECIVDRHIITEPQSTKAAGSDLAVPPALNGRVADIQPETANEKPETSDFTSSDPQRSVAPTSDGGGSGVSGDPTQALDVVTVPIYAAPGVVVSEHTPPKPVKRHPVSAAFAELGQDTKALRCAIFTRHGGVAEPIVKIGPVILDGWARYNIARGLFIDYPVTQYGGDDAVLDAVRWNLASRALTSQQRGKVFGALAKLYPEREADLEALFMGAVREAAE